MEKNTLITRLLILLFVLSQVNIHSMTEKQKWLVGGATTWVLLNLFTFGCMEYGRPTKINHYVNNINKCTDIYNQFDALKKINEPINSEEFTKLFNEHETFLSTLFTKEKWISKKQSMTTPTKYFFINFQIDIKSVLRRHEGDLRKKKEYAEKHPVFADLQSMLNAHFPGHKSWFLINVMIPVVSLFGAFNQNSK